MIAVHDRQLAEHGGLPGLRDANLLDSALARPQQLHAYADPPADLCDLAASLVCGLARNHPFMDANKRTAVLSGELFLELNGATLNASDVALYPVILAVAQGAMDEAALADWLRDHVSLSPMQVNEPAPPRYG